MPVLFSCQDVMATLVDLVPPNEFWRWKDMWTNSIRSAVFSAALVEYLTSRKLIAIERVSEILGSELIFNIFSVSAWYDISPSQGRME